MQVAIERVHLVLCQIADGQSEFKRFYAQGL